MVRLNIPTLFIISIILFGTAKPQVNHIMVLISFDEWMDTTGFADSNNFIWSGGLVTTDVELIDTALALLIVSMPVNIQWYSVEVFNVYDLAGNLINSEQDTTGIMWIGSPLPVELSSFTAKVINERVHLKWITETEVNNYGFDIERSTNKKTWEKIEFVEGHGNSNSPKFYSFTDKNPIGGGRIKYRLKQIDTDGAYEYSNIVEVELIPDEFALFQNYPYPFNPNTKIKYQIPKESRIIIRVYDIIGAEVLLLLDEEKEAGRYSVEFNATSLPSGIYFYQLQAGSFVETKKMVLMK